MSMNNTNLELQRIRGRNLFIVEGHNEKEKLLSMIIKCFPQMGMNEDNIIIYGTNIYDLYNEIVKEYDSNWDELDVDLPFIVTRKLHYNDPLRKQDFTNIVLIFDYERHDPLFSIDKISRMQSYFTDMADTGKLYINYPMVESYMHFDGVPNNSFESTCIPVTLNPGNKYKSLVRDTYIAKLFGLPRKISEILSEKYYLEEENKRNECVLQLLSVKNVEKDLKALFSDVQHIINEYINHDVKSASNQIYHTLLDLYLDKGYTYYEYMIYIISIIVYHNICKAKKICFNSYDIEKNELQESFRSIDLLDVLNRQNEYSDDSYNGIIWVLNTSVFIVPDYNINLLVL